MNEIEKYYITQAGSGLSGFRGVRYQRGRGFFGRLLSGAVFPLLRFLGKSALKTGTNVARDVLDSDDFSLGNIKNVALKNIKSDVPDISKQILSKLKGEGRRRRKKGARKRKRVGKKSNIKKCLKLFQTKKRIKGTKKFRRRNKTPNLLF